MKHPNVEEKFKEIEAKNPFWSSYICFAETCQVIPLSRYEVRKYFSKLVDKDDYDKSDLEDLWENLYELNDQKFGEREPKEVRF